MAQPSEARFGSVPLVLASASPSRAQVLRQAGFRFTQQASSVDEDAIAAAMASAATRDLVLALARAKAEAVASQPDYAATAVVLGCDSLLELDGQSYGKPHTPAAAVERWRLQRGRTASLLTGHWLMSTGTGRAVGRCVASDVTFVDATDEEIANYVASGEPLGVAGAFTLEGRAGPLIAGVHGDPSNVLGLSLPGLRTMLAELGYTLAEVTAAPGHPVGETRRPAESNGS